MILGRVVGDITSTINHPFYDGKRLLLIEKISMDGAPQSGYLVAADSAGTGADETVLVLDEVFRMLYFSYVMVKTAYSGKKCVCFDCFCSDLSQVRNSHTVTVCSGCGLGKPV